MQYYFAPLEGLTDSVFRAVHQEFFPGLKRYYTPFLSPTVHRNLTQREQWELPQAASLPYALVPQVLTKSPEDFLWLASRCRDLGYEEINLNLGCPSGTVTAKGKGSGMLQDRDTLDAFLYEIFNRTPLPVSVKTRIGFWDPEEWPAILEIYNRYPIRELTVHPRVRSEFYKGEPDLEAFSYAVNHAKMPLCYNGNLSSMGKIREFSQKFPQVEAVMIGRGLIGDPGMLCPGGTDRVRLRQFSDRLLDAYTQAFGSSRNAMFRLKENWRYLGRRFAGSEKLCKRLRKTTRVEEFTAITHEILDTLPMLPELDPDW